MGEKEEIRGKSSIAALQERALDLIASRPEGVFQSDLRRLLQIDSSKCSKVVVRLQASGQISRESVPASSTYLIKPVSVTALENLVSGQKTEKAVEKTKTCNKDANASGSRKSSSGGILKSSAIDNFETGATYNPERIIAINSEGHIESINDQIKRDIDGRLKMMIDQQISRLLENRIGQANGKTASSICRRINGPVDSIINNTINCIVDRHPLPNHDYDKSISGIEKQILCRVPNLIENRVDDRVDDNDDKPGEKSDRLKGDSKSYSKNGSKGDGRIDDAIDTSDEGKTGERAVISYFDCCREGDGLEISGQIDGCFSISRPGSNSHIDSYLTEIFLLYLTRATSY